MVLLRIGHRTAQPGPGTSQLGSLCFLSLPPLDDISVLSAKCKCPRESQLASSFMLVSARVLQFFHGLSVEGIHPLAKKRSMAPWETVRPVSARKHKMERGPFF